MAILSRKGLAKTFDQRWLAAGIFALGILSLAAPHLRLWTHFDAKDFSVYYTSSSLMRSGINPYRVDIIPFARELAVNTRGAEATDPPTFLMLIKPLSMLPVRQAYWIWQVINLAALAGALYLLLAPRFSGLTANFAMAMTGLALMYLPVNNHIVSAQSKLLLLLLLVVTIRCMERGRDVIAGFSLALAGLLRIYPMLLLGYLLVQRRWRTLAFTSIWLAVEAGLTLAYLGPGYMLDFLSSLGSLTVEFWRRHTTDISISAFVSRAAWSVGVNNEVAISAVVALADLALIYFMIKAATENDRDREWAAFALWVAGTVVLSPVAWLYDMVLMLIPLAQIASAIGRGAASNRVAILAVAAYVFAQAIDVPMIGSKTYPAAVPDIEFICLLATFAAAYWFNFDSVAPADQATMAA